MKSTREAAAPHVGDVLPFAHIHVTKLVREVKPLYRANGQAPSIGNFIDRAIYESAMSNEEISELRFEIEPEQWAELSARVRENNH